VEFAEIIEEQVDNLKNYYGIEYEENLKKILQSIVYR